MLRAEFDPQGSDEAYISIGSMEATLVGKQSAQPSKTTFPSHNRLIVVYLWASTETMTYYKYGLHYSLDIDLNEGLLPENMMHLTIQLRPGYTVYTISWAFFL